MISGIGVDIVDTVRFQRSIDWFGNRLLSKIFTAEEIHSCPSNIKPARHFAACFASKEALSKALATGTSGIFQWKHVEVFFNPSGKPEFKFHYSIAKRLEQNNVKLSISLSELHVVAFVVIQSPQ